MKGIYLIAIGAIVFYLSQKKDNKVNDVKDLVDNETKTDLTDLLPLVEQNTVVKESPKGITVDSQVSDNEALLYAIQSINNTTSSGTGVNTGSTVNDIVFTNDFFK